MRTGTNNNQAMLKGFVKCNLQIHVIIKHGCRKGFTKAYTPEYFTILYTVAIFYTLSISIWNGHAWSVHWNVYQV